MFRTWWRIAQAVCNEANENSYCHSQINPYYYCQTIIMSHVLSQHLMEASNLDLLDAEEQVGFFCIHMLGNYWHSSQCDCNYSKYFLLAKSIYSMEADFIYNWHDNYVLFRNLDSYQHFFLRGCLTPVYRYTSHWYFNFPYIWYFDILWRCYVDDNSGNPGNQIISWSMAFLHTSTMTFSQFADSTQYHHQWAIKCTALQLLERRRWQIL